MGNSESGCGCEGGATGHGAGSGGVSAGGTDPGFYGVKVSEVQPPGWILFGHLAPKGPKPAATVIHVGGDFMNNLAREDFNKIGFMLLRHGVQSVSLDGPCYGFDLKPGEQEGLPGWRARMERGEPFIADFNAKVSRLLDHLIKEGYTDPERVIVCGSCRGGFLALHWAASDARVKFVVALTPATDMSVVEEFQGMKNYEAMRALAVHHQVDKLADRKVWSCLGFRDDRVKTESCLSFVQKLMDAAVKHNGGKHADIEFHMSGVVGHSTYERAHEDAVGWVLGQLAKVG